MSDGWVLGVGFPAQYVLKDISIIRGVMLSLTYLSKSEPSHSMLHLFHMFLSPHIQSILHTPYHTYMLPLH